MPSLRACYGHAFVDSSVEEQFAILAALQHGALEAAPEWDGVPQKELFKKLLGLSVEALASHPTIWSEIGYAGPLSPRVLPHRTWGHRPVGSQGQRTATDTPLLNEEAAF